jgi:hypothetical protein
MRHPWDYSGFYTLTITARSCSPGFPEEAKRRVYTARVEQTAANLRVSLSGDFLMTADGGAFAGAVTTTGEIAFFLGSVFDSFYGVTERLSDGTVLMIFGTIEAAGTPAGIFPTLRSQDTGLGEMFHYPPFDSVFYPHSYTGWCDIDRFDLVPQ